MKRRSSKYKYDEQQDVEIWNHSRSENEFFTMYLNC